MEEQISLDALARQRILTKMSPKEGYAGERLNVNSRVAQYARQEGIMMNEAWRRVDQRAYELVTEAFGKEVKQ